MDILSIEERKAIEKCISKMKGAKDKKYFREFLEKLMVNKLVHHSLLDSFPEDPKITGKTKFDQIYDAASSLAFPGYDKSTLEKFLGNDFDQEIKIWRVILPSEYGVSAVLLRASTFQDAFALGCDYACRASLRLYGEIPSDLNIRVVFVSEKALRRHLNIRSVNRKRKRNELKLKGRTHTFKQLSGARIAALGHLHEDPRRSIARYIETKDLHKIYTSKHLSRISSVESEVLLSEMKKLKID